MDADVFDAWTHDLIGRRSRRAVVLLFASSAAALLGLNPARAGHRKKRCQKPGIGCDASRRCCSGLACTAGTCCPAERSFVSCPAACLCPSDRSYCCAYEADRPAACAGPADAPEFCCPADFVCGDVCCNPDQDRCIDGECVCILANPLDCKSGGGGFSRVRRFP
jgi:hypothetical protein